MFEHLVCLGFLSTQYSSDITNVSSWDQPFCQPFSDVIIGKYHVIIMCASSQLKPKFLDDMSSSQCVKADFIQNWCNQTVREALDLIKVSFMISGKL